MNPLESHAFLFMWIGFLLLMSCAIGVFFLWGIRAGQFSNQERARYLALEAEIPVPQPGGDAEEKATEPGDEPDGRGGERRRIDP